MIDLQKEELASKLRGSLLEFMRFFYKVITNRDFIVSTPECRESHHITVCRALTDLVRTQRHHHGLIINMPPGYGKSVMTCLWIAWCYAQYPDCNFLYISYSSHVATKHTAFIKQIMSCRAYQYLFNVNISADSRAKAHFQTDAGGAIMAFGSSGSITGMNAGLPGLNRFSGALVYDDAHKPDEAHQETLRDKVIRNYSETVLQRFRDNTVPALFTGQRVHEADLPAHLLRGNDVRTWDRIVLKGLDDAGNALYPEVQSKEYLLKMRDTERYVFASQIQQEPVAAGNGLYKFEDFIQLEDDPEFVATIITADTAETEKAWNDATVFSFFGIYYLPDTGNTKLALHWLDCIELRIEPRELEDAFISFYTECGRHKIPPSFAAIEKKSTGVTLLSVLQKLRGITIREIERNRTSGSKSQRFIDAQATIAAKLISINKYAKHKDMVLSHMTKITANNTHRFDDIADTCTDAIRIALIDKSVYFDKKGPDTTSVAFKLNKRMVDINRLRSNRYGTHT